MGTTVTAAYLADDVVVVAHVGDSRAYLLRDGDLIRLTRDHSLVDELIRRGKLTEEQAESHPQRSVITRALGPEPTVEVDVEAFPARAGDVFLLCSDGLTVDGPRAQAQAAADRPRPLAGADGPRADRRRQRGRRARQHHGDPVPARGRRRPPRPAEEAAVTAEYDTFAGEAAAPRQGVTKPMPATDEAEAEYRQHGTVALQAVRPRAEPDDAAPPPPPPERTVPLPGDGKPKKRRRRKRSGGGLLLLLAIVLPLLVGAWLATRAVYFVGTDPDGPAWSRSTAACRTSCRSGSTSTRSGTSRASRSRTSPRPAASGLIDHQLRSRDDAEDLVIALEKGQVE